MSGVALHMLDSLHTWLQWVTGLSATAAGVALFAHLPILDMRDGDKKTDLRSLVWRVAFVAAALFACAGTLLVFVPSAADVRVMRLENK